MAAQANILATTLLGLPGVGGGLAVITSSATVDTDTTFAPDGQEANGVFKWVDRGGLTSAGVIMPILYPSITFSALNPKGGAKPNQPGNRIERTNMKVNVPLPNITSPSTGSGIQPQPSKAGDIAFHLGVSKPEFATAAQIQMAFSLFCSAVADLVQASDASPIHVTGSPLRARVLTGEQVW